MMSEAVARQAVRKLLELTVKHAYRQLKLKYAGGEPTLNFAVLRAAHREAARYAAQVGVGLEAVILTNGTRWDDEMLDFVAGEGLRLGISLDGGEVAHNRLRRYSDGRGSFRDVASTIERALSRGIGISLSITITGWNLDGVAAAVQFAMERSLPFNLNFVREAAPAPWQPEPEALLAALRSAFAVMERLLPTYPRSLAHTLDRSRFDAPHTRPCSAGRDYVAVGVTGQVAPCQMKLSEPWSHLAAEDPLAEVRQRGQTLFGPTVDELPSCAICPWRYACAGGCPLLRGTAAHAAYCRVYQELYPALVRLEGLRLIARQAAGASVAA